MALAALLPGCSSAGPAAKAATKAASPAAGPAAHTTTGSGSLYTANRAPLLPSPLIKLPIGSITPRGWLRGQLELEAKGMTGHLEELSKWCRFDGSAWVSPTGEGNFGWEELPYWLKGYGDLGYVLKDERIIAEARRWIDGVLSSQQPDGYFGPKANRTGLDGHPDLWPHMVMLNVLQSFHEATGDPRVLPFMTRYMQWLHAQPPETFARGYWPKMRFGDTIESAHWLYNRTGDAFLLDLARTIHENMGAWRDDVPDWHNVNIAQGFREPGVFYEQAGQSQLLERAEQNYAKVMALYGQFPGGGFAGDEDCRPGCGDPRQGFETCGMVEFMHSFEMLAKISGDAVWADRAEEIAFNSLPAAFTPDLRALHYLTGANMVQLDKASKAPDLANGGTMLSYSPFEVYRCCEHNVSHGWPYYAEELWHATADRGLCATLFAASEVRARVGDGTEVVVDEQTDYPFGDTVTFTLSTPGPVDFPLRWRVPAWCRAAAVSINGGEASATVAGPAFGETRRLWRDGDKLTLHLPMPLTVRPWPTNKNAVSVSLGPLEFSLAIAERWQRSGGTDAWPESEVYPASPWNYGLLLDATDPASSFRITRRAGPLASQPFTQQAAPIELAVRARRIPGWTQDATGLVDVLQPSPVRSAEPEEIVTLIPMGAARLRISAFPVIGSGPDAREWQPVPR